MRFKKRAHTNCPDYSKCRSTSNMEVFKFLRENHSFDRLLVLSAQGRQRPVIFSLTAPRPQATPGEEAVTELLRLVRDPHPQFDARYQRTASFAPRTPSFLSEGLPRDRRGRINRKSGLKIPESLSLLGATDEQDGEEAHSWSHPTYHDDREQDRLTLESLRFVMF